MRAVVIAMLGLLLVPALAHAEDIAAYQVDGDADAGGADPRVAALDEAFGRAAVQALGDVLDAPTRKTHKPTLDKEIVARARLWVVGYKVDKEDVSDGRKQLSVTVRVDRDKMRDRLEQLSIVGGAGDPAPAATARTSVILLRVSETGGVRSSFGASAEKEVPGLGALASSLRGSGLTIKRATTAGPAPKAGGELPLEDDEAEAIAVDSKAEIAVIAGVTVSAAVAVRGVATTASLVTAHVRVIARGKKLMGQGVGAVASRGAEPSAITAAIERALIAASGDAMPAAQAPVTPAAGFSGDDTPVAEPGVVLIRIPAKTPFALVAAELKYLGGAKGVSRAALHRVSPGGWVIGVSTTEAVSKIASIAKKAPTADTSVQVKIVGDLVELSIAGGR